MQGAERLLRLHRESGQHRANGVPSRSPACRTASPSSPRALPTGDKVVVDGQYRLCRGRPRQDRHRRSARSGAGAPPARPAEQRHEHLRNLHPPADRHVADDAGPAGVRCGDLQSAAGRGAAQRRFPDHHRVGDPARRQPRDHGLVGRHAARAAVRRHPRPRLDELDQRARHAPRSPCSSTSTAASTARRPTCRPRSTPRAGCCRRTCPTRRPTARSTRPTAPS